MLVQAGGVLAALEAPPAVQPGGDVTGPVNPTLRLVGTVNDGAGPLGVEDSRLLTVGVDVEDHELLVGPARLAGARPALRVEDGPIQIT